MLLYYLITKNLEKNKHSNVFNWFFFANSNKKIYIQHVLSIWLLFI